MNMNNKFEQYSIDPKTRYSNHSAVLTQKQLNQVKDLYEKEEGFDDKYRQIIKEKDILTEKSNTKPNLLSKPQAKPQLPKTQSIPLKPRERTFITTPDSSLSSPSCCYVCDRSFFITDTKKTILKYIMHRQCFKCHYCDVMLSDKFFKHQIQPSPLNKCIEYFFLYIYIY